MDEDISSLLHKATNTYAVIIGIGKYKDPEIRSLKYTYDDAKELYNILVDPKEWVFKRTA